MYVYNCIYIHICSMYMHIYMKNSPTALVAKHALLSTTSCDDLQDFAWQKVQNSLTWVVPVELLSKCCKNSTTGQGLHSSQASIDKGVRNDPNMIQLTVGEH